MFKLMHKKLNKKGFTLAELLIVVAIIAILVAIAIPIFTQAMKRAQIRTNDANIRSTKAAAVTEILDRWDVYKYGSKRADPEGHGWIAIGHVLDDGTLEGVAVYLARSVPTSMERAIAVSGNTLLYYTRFSSLADDLPNHTFIMPAADDDQVIAAAGVNGKEATNGSQYGYTSPEYYTLVYIDEVDEAKAK